MIKREQHECMFTCALLQHNDDTLAIGSWLHTYSLLVHQTVEAERVPGLQVVGLLSWTRIKLMRRPNNLFNINFIIKDPN